MAKQLRLILSFLGLSLTVYLWLSNKPLFSTLCAIPTSYLLFLNRTNSSDPYGLFHLTLNERPGEDPSTPPTTEWLNMGYWKDTSIFPDACRALALKTIQATRLKLGANVLDVGHGTGESLVLILTDPSIPRPARLIGVTSLPAHLKRSQERVDHILSTLDAPIPQVNLFCGDAVCKNSPESHPLHPSSDLFFDGIIALDCAYHFDTRHNFLVQAFDKLSSGGRIAIADICFSPESSKSYKRKLITSIIRIMPQPNVLSIDTYVKQMMGVGYDDVTLEDITKEVFPGFLKFLKTKGWTWWLFGMLFEWFIRHTGAHFVLVSGTKA